MIYKIVALTIFCSYKINLTGKDTSTNKLHVQMIKNKTKIFMIF